MMKKETNVIWKDDTNILLGSAFATKNGEEVSITMFSFVDDKFVVYMFPPEHNKVSWVDHKELDYFCDTQYSTKEFPLQEQDAIRYTIDIASYYGPINLDGNPLSWEKEEFEKWIEQIQQ